STSMCNADGDLIASGKFDLPAHVGTMPYMMRGIFRTWGMDRIASLQPGDIIIHNDPFIGGSHNLDVRFIMPIFWDGELVAWACNSGHWSDIGGAVAGGFNANARSAYEEGLTIPPCLIVRQGILDEDLVRFILR